MNTLKNVLFFGLLLAVLCGVYLSLNRPAESTTSSQGQNPDTKPPVISIPGLNGAPLSTASSGQETNAPPNFPSQPPSVSPPQVGGGTGLQFQQPNTGNPTNTAAPWPSGSDASAPPLPVPPTTVRDRNYPDGVRNPAGTGNGPGLSSSDPSIVSLPPPPDHLQSFANSHGSSSTAASPPADPSAASRINRVMQQVELQVGDNRFAEGLMNLTQLYGNPDLPMSREQTREVTKILDSMAAKVIYSREHWLERAYRVQAGDTLEIIAERYQVPALLLARINGIRDPLTGHWQTAEALPLGKELKVLKGPFSAFISTDRSELTMKLDGRYAGRFNVALSNDLSHAQGMWRVVKKGPSIALPESRPGKQWMDLEDNAKGIISVQGTNDTGVASGRDSRNTIWLSEQDMDDVFTILSVGSRVIIQR